MISGVYAIFMKGGEFVYVGESKDVETRYSIHIREWLWPNDHQIQILEEMPGSTGSERRRRETHHSEALNSAGYFRLSLTGPEMLHQQRSSPLFALRADATCRKRYGPDYRSIIALKASATKRAKGAEELRAIALRARETRLRRYGPSGMEDPLKAWKTRRSRYGASGMIKKPYPTEQTKL
jgi:hypothetical protein